MNLQKMISIYLFHCQNTKKLEFLTLKAYSIDLNQFYHWLLNHAPTALNITQLDKNVLSNYLSQVGKKYKAKTLKRKIASLKAFFNYLEFEDYIAVSPFRKMKCYVKEPKRLPKALSLFEIEKLLRHLYSHGGDSFTSVRNRAVFEILFASGLRVAELSHLKISDYDRTSQILFIQGKGNKERLIYVSHVAVIDAVNQYLSLRPDTECDNFFINRLGERLSEQSIRFFIEKLGRTVLNKHVTPHMLRHSFATLLLEEGVDIRYIQTLLGHSSITTTQIYAAATAVKQRQLLTSFHPRNRIRNLSE